MRISGPRAGDALKALTGKIPQPRHASFARIRDPQTNEIIDEALALFFPAPKSETGEDVAEIQLHGGRAVIAALFAALARMDGFRLAEPGEFTRRAFENGKLDLTAIEGLADLIYADTDAQRRQALRQLQGLLGNRAEDWRTRLIEALALAEAGIDFSDEADVASNVTAQALGGRAQARRARSPTRSPTPRAASVCAKAWWSRSRVRRMPASRPCSIASRGARPRSSRPSPAPPAT